MNRTIRLMLRTDGRVMNSSKHCYKRATFYRVHARSAKAIHMLTFGAVRTYHSYYLVESKSLVLFLTCNRMEHRLYFLPVVLEFRWIIEFRALLQGSGGRRTVAIAQEVKGNSCDRIFPRKIQTAKLREAPA